MKSLSRIRLVLIPVLFLSFLSSADCNNIKTKAGDMITLMSQNLSEFIVNRSSTEPISNSDVIDFANSYYTDTTTLLLTIDTLHSLFQALFTQYSFPDQDSSYQIAIENLISEDYIIIGGLSLPCYNAYESGFVYCIGIGMMIGVLTHIAC
jgi:hypothetical protein